MSEAIGVNATGNTNPLPSFIVCSGIFLFCYKFSPPPAAYMHLKFTSGGNRVGLLPQPSKADLKKSLIL